MVVGSNHVAVTYTELAFAFLPQKESYYFHDDTNAFFFFFRKILISWAFLRLFCFSSSGGFGYLSRASVQSFFGNSSLPFL